MTDPRTLPPPLVIGGTGGSGTRLIALLCQIAGYHLGERHNDALDAIDFLPLHERWLNPYLSGLLDDSQLEQMRAELLDQVASLHADVPPEQQRTWGWKAPRSLLLMPMLESSIPGLRFIHVLRDGRDMAYSNNQNQLRKHGPALLSKQQLNKAEWLQSMAFWQRANLRAAHHGQNFMAGRYLRVRYEDVLSNDTETMANLANFLGVDPAQANAMQGHARPTTTVGRWLQRPAAEQSALLATGDEGLRYFGYL